jgi:PmbA protein
LAKDGDLGVMASEGDSQRDFKALSGEKIARTAAEKTLARLGARRPQTGRYTVVLENQTAEAMIGLLCGYFSAKEVDEKTSPLAGKLGQKVFSEKLTLIDDPFHVQGAASRPFDDAGYATKKSTVVENGVLKTYLTNSSLAKKLKLSHTASASRAPSTDLDVSTSNVIVQTGSQNLAQLLSSDQKVILITNALGMAGVRHTSGDFSIPVEGFLYENGKRSVALKDFLISGNLLQFFSNVGAVSNDVLPPLSAILCPSLLIHDVNISGQA